MRRALEGTNLAISTFACGLGDLFTMPQEESEAVLDAYVQAGGNFFDTAHSYSFWVPGGNGLSEIRIGEYVRTRGLEDAVIATKGGHHAAWRYRSIFNDEYLSPGRLRADLDDSLARLEVDTIDLYYVHRDDRRVPVGEIIGFLNEEICRGRIRHIGAANWSMERIAEANDYARRSGLQPFVISTSLWSLARYGCPPGQTPPHPDYAALAGREIQWHRDTGFPLAPFTPTAHGFFGRDLPDADAGYLGSGNVERRERALLLARERGCSASQIALAWLIRHEFPVFPVLGTRNPGRMAEALASESIPLTPGEMAWLDLASEHRVS